MALGGGSFTSQNKILPGAYINVVSTARANATLSERGVVAVGLSLPYSPGGVFEVTNATIMQNSLQVFGCDYSAEELKPIREILLNAKKVYIYNTSDNGTKASNTYATAKYAGTGGNNISIKIEADVDNSSNYIVYTLMNNAIVDKQSVAKTGKTTALSSNNYVDWKSEVTLTETVGTAMTGGTTTGNSGTISQQNALNAFEAYTFNTIAIGDTSSDVQNMVKSYVTRLRNERGVKIQGIVYNTEADDEGVINVVIPAEELDYGMIFWVAGAAAGCALNRSLTNKIYDGEYTAIIDETQSELEEYIKEGKFAFHKVNDDVRVLMDINSLKTTTAEKGDIFKENQVIRVADQIANDIAVIFNTKYIGAVQNNATGRALFKADIIAHHNQLQDINAIENFTADNITIEAGSDKGSVVVSDEVTVVGTMTKLYMTVYVS